MTDEHTGQPTQPTQPQQAGPRAQSQQTHTTRVTGVPRVVAGRYRLLAELGRGGMGVVWRAEDTVIGRHVAVKELVLPEGAEEEAAVFQERVLREVRTGGKVNDPAVVTVYDVIAEDATTYIVMELVEAPTLSQLVRQNGPLPEHRVAAIGEQVLSALGAAHEAGIVHRDVKPGNVMVGPNGRVKLTDFGIAQAVDDPRLTTSGMLVGSPAFMAPERVAGQDATPASDLWALGASLFFAVEGTVAHERATTAATLHAIVNEVPYLSRAHGPLASAIMGLLTAAPEGRISAEQARGLLSITALRQSQPQPPQPMQAQTPPGGQTVAHGAQPHPMQGAPGQFGAAPSGPGAKRGRRKLAVTGAALGAVALLVGGFFLGKPIWAPTDSAHAATLTYGQGGDIAELNVSDSYSCLNTELAKGKPLSESNWVDCGEPHVGEWYDAETAAGGSDNPDAGRFSTYPGLERLTELGETLCASSFHTNTFPDDVRESLQYVVLVPTQEEWGKKTDVQSSEYPTRSVHCVAMRRDGAQLTTQQMQDTW